MLHYRVFNLYQGKAVIVYAPSQSTEHLSRDGANTGTIH